MTARASFVNPACLFLSLFYFPLFYEKHTTFKNLFCPVFCNFENELFSIFLLKLNIWEKMKFLPPDFLPNPATQLKSKSPILCGSLPSHPLFHC